ncbi:MAG: hypothetical protein QN209_10255 [Armatimonadota bacterium]|nr:hypothetical protein [Armatimonadota bacterium]
MATWYFAWQTLFEFDAVLMFCGSIHSAVLEVLDEYIQSQQLRPLEEEERRPVLHAFYGG